AHGGALRDARARETGGGAPPAGPRPARRRRALARVRAAGQRGARAGRDAARARGPPLGGGAMSVDLSTTYLGLQLASPVVASASPLTGDLDALRRLEQAGAGAVVLPSLFEEQIEHEQVGLHAALEHGAHSYGEALTYFPEMDDYNTGPEEYVEHLADAKRTLSIPVIASLNGVTPGGWTRYARLLQQAGADAIELNVYAVETDPYAS